MCVKQNFYVDTVQMKYFSKDFLHKGYCSEYSPNPLHHNSLCNENLPALKMIPSHSCSVRRHLFNDTFQKAFHPLAGEKGCSQRIVTLALKRKKC